jgi:hypothetical protein
MITRNLLSGRGFVEKGEREVLGKRWVDFDMFFEKGQVKIQ